MNERLQSLLGKRSECRFLALLLLVAWGISAPAFAQPGSPITGQVTDAVDNSPIPGVNVVVRGTQIGTTTDNTGRFTIRAASGATLVVSSIGYVEQEIVVGNQSTISVKLGASAQSLNEVVVVGYGTQKKRDVTSAISTVKGKELENRPVPGVQNLLQGKVSGVTVTSDGGEPGGGSKIRIRGVGTLSSNDPLYIIDGIPINGGLYNLNPNDVESVEIFKDAAAAAIYGSRAANGVVFVTTKKGKSGKTQVSFDTYAGVSNLSKYYNMAGADEYYEMKRIEGGGKPVFTDLYQQGYNTNWADAILRQGTIQSYNLSLSGGSENFKFFTGAGYLDQKGVQQKSDYKRLNVRFNSDYTLGKRIRLSSQLNVSNEVRHGFNGLYQALIAAPIVPVYKTPAEIAAIDPADRELNQYYDHISAVNYGNNVAGALARNNGQSNWLNLIGNVSATATILDGLTATSTYGIEASRYDSYGFSPKYLLGAKEQSANTSASASFNKSFHWVWNNIVQYNKTFAQKHTVSLLGGLVTEETDGRSLSASKSNGLSNEEHQQIIDAMTANAVAGGGQSSSSMISYIGRANYNYDDRYLLQVSFRRDGTYRFAQANRWGNFPSVSLGWRVSNEQFVKNLNLNWLNDLKFRASWGQLGNEQIGEYQYLSIIAGQAKRGYTLGAGDSKYFVQGYGPTQLSNPDLKWETTESTNLGFDASFLNGKLGLQFDWFNRLTKDVLYKENLPGYVGSPNAESIAPGSVYVNGGQIQNRGFDAELTYRETFGKLGMTVGANVSHYNNVVKSLGARNNPIYVSDERVAEVVRMLPGDALGSFYGFIVDGYYQSADEVKNGPEKDVKQAGDFKYRDVNGDGKVNNDDRTVIGNPNPKLSYGLTLRLDYGGFDLTTFWQGVYGNDIYRLSNLYLTGWENQNAYAGIVNDSWSKTGDNTKYPRLGRYYQNYINPNTASIEKGSYLRLKNLQLGYNIPLTLTNKLRISGVRVYVGGENLLTFTKYSGNDPELGNGLTLASGEGGRAGSPSYLSGIDYANAYPIQRTYTVGLNVKF